MNSEKLAFSPYALYKDSGVEWLGQVPEHWEVKRVKDIVSVKRGASPRPIDDPIYFDDDGEFSWVRIADLSASERYLLTTKEKLSKLGASRSVKRYPNDFILSIAGTVGKPIITKIKCCIHDGFVWFPNLKINPEYWYYCFSTGLPYQGLGKLGTQLNLNTETVGLISLPLPPKNETAQIIDYLDQKTAQIDHEIDLLSKKTTLYSNLKQSLINETVTRGLDKNAALKDSGVEWLGQVPEHWQIKRLKDIGTSIIGIIYSPEDVVDNDSQGVLVLRSSNIQKGKLSLLDVVYVNQKIRPRQTIRMGDILICSRNGSRDLIGKNICIDESISGCTFGAFMTVYRSRYFEFISKFFNSQIFKAQSGLFMSSTINQLTINTLNNFLIPLPPLPEQKAIANYLDQKTLQIDNMVSAIDRKIATLQELRKTLINDVVTGQIKVI
ncbi:MAG: restriction endonuclease subunit S [Agitococcus sp.]|nr:restriction endonuclease subunit S [Agitococcus sp.]